MSKKPSAGGKIQWTKMFRKLSPYTIRKGFRYMKHYGPKEFWIRLHERFEPEEVPYGLWYRAYIPTEETLETQRKQKFDYSPLISIAVPAYQTPVEFLRQMIESLIVQTYSNWELCIVNASPDNEEMQKVLAEYSAGDSRVRFCNLKENLGIAENTNRAFAMTKGEFVGLLDHDDLLAPNALYEIVKILQDHPQADALYTDEDKVTTELDEHFQPHLKPDFNLDLLRSNNYICHFFVVQKSIVEKAGGFRKEFDGAQDYDFIFRCTENAGEVLHVPEILYHWRTHKASTADNPASKMYAFEAGKRAIEAHLERTGTKGEVSHTQDLGFYRVKYPVQGKPLVSVIIPNKDEKETLQTCLEMLEKNKGEVLSGESIAGELGCTRAAVWKAVKSLREEGYHIEAGPNKGYMLAKDTNRLSQEGIRLFLDDPKVKIDIYDELESTNQTAKKEAMMGEAGHGAFVIARSQTAGRGRRGREFYSPADTGLYMSVILKPQGTIHDSLLITTAAAVAVYRAVAQLCEIQLDIKWVNDLFYKGKKVCGILTEAVTDFESGNIEFVVVGMGLNLYLDQENLPQKLRSIAGALYETKEDAEQTDRNKLTAMIVNELRKETADMKLSPDYVTHNMIPGHQITITDGNSSRQAFALEICRDGRLKVREEDGQETILSFGEVSVSM